MEKLQRENERLAKEKDEAEAELRDEHGRTELTTEVPLEEQRQLYVDIQAELTEAVERGNSLEDRYSSLEDRLVQVMEEGEVERLRAIEAVRSKFEDTLLQQVQELQSCKAIQGTAHLLIQIRPCQRNPQAKVHVRSRRPVLCYN